MHGGGDAARMRLGPRLLGRLGVADGVTVANAAVGLLAVLLANEDLGLAARLILLGAIADGLDGVVARRLGSSDVGHYLDSLADVAAFCVAPAVLVVSAARGGPGAAIGAGSGIGPGPLALAALGVALVYVIAGVVRLGVYTAYDDGNGYTEGVPTTLAATVLGAATLAGAAPPVLIAAAAGFAYLMLSGVKYPDLFARDALAMGVLQGLVVLVPGALGELLASGLLVAALAYLLFAPRFYWRD
jgi:CDP-diacylglycerol--serine O-phosphatidyltransferase